MKYTHETLHKLLLRMQSLDYSGYKDVCQIFFVPLRRKRRK